MVKVNAKKKVAFISSFLPRKCGIATFTSDLINNVKLTAGEEIEPSVVAMNSDDNICYDEPVELDIRKDVKTDYTLAAEYINLSDVDIVSIQHEFGLFGGDAGSFLGLFLDRLNKPLITTLHTVLERPPAEYFNSLIDLCGASDKVIVMNKRGIKMLRDVYAVPKEKIELIPHGIPDMPFVDSARYKHELGLGNRKTILTFGLIGRNKGIEVMLSALPEIVKKDPSVLYIVLGTTHPEVIRHEGLSYKHRLQAIVKDLGLQKNVLFYDCFVSKQQLYKFLAAADIYVTPYLHKEQLTSGTLAFAVGTGKAIVSTPYWAAEELLAHDRGKLVRFDDHKQLAQTVIEILSSYSLFTNLRKRAYEYGRSMTWPVVGQAYWELFETLLPSVPAPLPSCSLAMNRRMETEVKTRGIELNTSDYGQRHIYSST